MPVIYNHKTSEGVMVSVWRLDEEVDYFRSAMYLYEGEKEELRDLSARRQLEWYASRYLLHQMSGWETRGPCLKDEYGKPYLQGSSNHISLSHSNDLIAVAKGPPAIGVDIQIVVDKISRIAHKFASGTELEFIQGDHYIRGLHVIWGAKEAIYKAYGRRQVELRKHINISPFEPGERIETRAKLTLENLNMTFDVYAQKLENYYLVLATAIGD